MLPLRYLVTASFVFLMLVSCTGDESLSDMTFDIDVAVRGTEARITVNPSQPSSRYYFDSLSRSDLGAFGNTVEESVRGYLESIVAMYQSMGYSRTSAVDLFASRGRDTYTYDCHALTDYVAFACALDRNARIASPIVTEYYTTGEVLPSDNVITLTAESVMTKSAVIRICTTNQDPYFVSVEPKRDFDGMGEEAIKDALRMKYGSTMGSMVHRGDRTHSAGELKPDTEYEVFAFGVAATVPTTPLFRTAFTTLSPTMTMTLKVDGYFDGDEVVKRYPGQYDKCEGKAFVIVRAEVGGDAEHYFYDAYYYYPGYDDPSSLPDSSVIQTLKLSSRGAVTDIPEVFMGVDWGADVIFFGVAENAAGDYSDVQRLRFTPEKDRCRPIEEFPYKKSGSDSLSREVKNIVRR